MDTENWPQNIFAVTLFTEDLNKSKQFYEKVFGLSSVFGDDNSAVYKIGETLINLLHISSADELVNPATVGSPSDGGRMVFTVHVDNVDAMCEELIEKKVWN